MSTPSPSSSSRPRVVVAVDFATHAPAICRGAISVIHQLGAEVILLHVMETGSQVPSDALILAPGAEDSQPVHSALESDARAHMAPLLEIFTQADIPVTLCLRHGPVVPSIWTCAAETDAAMVVVGSDVPTGLRRLFATSFTDAVLRDATRPVLVVKAQSLGPAPGLTPTRAQVHAEADG